ncbi:late embryogenesis abundant protein [Striga asiatica]|uniref:Late embryogenesis abundant protein n=1 Tax=Striga asiatica TaxID=4170 RepID=A0A5A7PI45_STRAF|nr:late embryogenesis abundant protein [Striga asiatica]
MEVPSKSPQPTPKQNKLSPIYNLVLPKQPLTPDSLLYATKLRTREQPIRSHSRKTNPMVWCVAILCMLFIILIIFFGIATLIIFITLQPKTPSFDTPAATLSAIYFNPPAFINGDYTFMANISNPNRRLTVRYEHARFELYFMETLMAAQIIEPFRESPGEQRVVTVHMLCRQVFLHPNLAMELQRQGQRNSVVYNVRGDFRVRVEWGLLHYSYWLHGVCQLEMTGPPNSVLLSHSCTTKK